ncbi:MAG: thermonuclease family protein [Mesorhizobium sp.]
MIKGIHIRLAGIDAPELDHPWGRQSKWALIHLCKGHTVTARFKPDELSHNRRVAECFLPDGRDLAAELVRIGLALDWPTFSGGKYRHLEPEDVRRKKLWRTAARQRGMLQVLDARQQREQVRIPPMKCNVVPGYQLKSLIDELPPRVAPASPRSR